ncbi:hypothetical protein O7600_20140 [Micromonospora sp. WMMA1998]|uniref:hypothetical protein n=1 Tax=Micromonospora sp. WMMA1998 TaxID=3015167 RepID=UPI00248BB709|nr:hypothetical protein [Micromonospora sp. WMMA1998]WBC13442.1 hypothetical protein O7600_20140 [Micromonospora sp. WMMA1998]
MSVTTWPPPASASDRHERAPVLDDDTGQHRLVVLRVARLWGRNVLIDTAGRVHCDGCNQLVDVDELSRPDNGHRPGLPYRATGRLVPARD